MFAADAARITEEMACGEDRKRTSGGVLVAIDSNPGAVVNEALLEAVLKRTRTTKHHMADGM